MVQHAQCVLLKKPAAKCLVPTPKVKPLISGTASISIDFPFAIKRSCKSVNHVGKPYIFALCKLINPPIYYSIYIL